MCRVADTTDVLDFFSSPKDGWLQGGVRGSGETVPMFMLWRK